MKIKSIVIALSMTLSSQVFAVDNKRDLDVEEVSKYEENPSYSVMSSMIPTNLPWPVDNKDIRHTSIFFDTDDAVEVSGRPCNGNRFEKHVGVDIQTSVGANIKAVYPGVVEHIGNGGNNWGKGIVISHDNNSWTSTTWHLTSDIQVSKGDSVVAGQVLGYIYDTSYPANDVPHVHFGIRPSPYDSYSIRGFGLCEEVNNNLLGFVNPYNHLSNKGYELIDDS